MPAILALGTAAATRVVGLTGARLWRTTLTGAAGYTCDWCDLAGRLAIYTWNEPARYAWGASYYCSLHCWGQRHGFTNL